MPLKKKSKVRGLVKANFKAYKVMLIKAVWYWHNDRKVCPCNRIESRNRRAYMQDN